MEARETLRDEGRQGRCHGREVPVRLEEVNGYAPAICDRRMPEEVAPSETGRDVG